MPSFREVRTDFRWTKMIKGMSIPPSFSCAVKICPQARDIFYASWLHWPRLGASSSTLGEQNQHFLIHFGGLLRVYFFQNIQSQQTQYPPASTRGIGPQRIWHCKPRGRARDALPLGLNQISLMLPSGNIALGNLKSPT